MSGAGAGSHIDGECLRSDLAYPYLLAAELCGQFSFMASGGATTHDLLAVQVEELTKVPTW